ncbi:class I SAM-dependent methyltransferase [Streptomyces beihaiensis]|uniref:S-adenosyl-L-methionine-dependent methyltransferase n=1 Tax=Streptomyces beihaiensis TaxID=2984495 RepID=A0ABT3TNP6_9ACTN|nr:class I SAM-dependent methyltransferase [Streptomyces beihaiensis]MCX3058669.1 class I SAM-dependent methyltransferase [Streptomyces beihaiensis]
MQTGRASRTALAVAQARAYHQIADEPRIFTDPYAVPLVGESGLEHGEFDHGIDPDLVRRRRLWLAARSRFADEALAEAVGAGVRQVVVLGAGLDTSALRNTRADVRYFEVDHPATQQWKRDRIAAAEIAVPSTLTFVPVDFETSTLAEGLAAAGFDRDRPAVFVCLGVVMYLTRAAADATWRYITGQGGGAADPRTVLVMDYALPREQTPERDERAKRVAAVGEPWLSWFTEDEMRRELVAAGFGEIEDHAASAVLDGYLGRTGAARTGVARIVRATVA